MKTFLVFFLILANSATAATALSDAERHRLACLYFLCRFNRTIFGRRRLILSRLAIGAPIASTPLAASLCGESHASRWIR